MKIERMLKEDFDWCVVAWYNQSLRRFNYCPGFFIPRNRLTWNWNPQTRSLPPLVRTGHFHHPGHKFNNTLDHLSFSNARHTSVAVAVVLYAVWPIMLQYYKGSGEKWWPINARPERRKCENTKTTFDDSQCGREIDYGWERGFLQPKWANGFFFFSTGGDGEEAKRVGRVPTRDGWHEEEGLGRIIISSSLSLSITWNLVVTWGKNSTAAPLPFGLMESLLGGWGGLIGKEDEEGEAK